MPFLFSFRFHNLCFWIVESENVKIKGCLFVWIPQPNFQSLTMGHNVKSVNFSTLFSLHPDIVLDG